MSQTPGQPEKPVSTEQLSSGVAGMLADAAIILFVIYGVVIFFQIFPPRFLDPLWLINFATALGDSMSFPLEGLLILHLAAYMAPLNNKVQSRRLLFSKLARWAVLGFLLLLPLLGLANWMGVKNVVGSNQASLDRLNRNANRLKTEIIASKSARDLQQRLNKLQGPAIPDSQLGQPLDQLKQQSLAVVNQVLNTYTVQLQGPKSAALVPVYWQSIRAGVLAIIGAVGFAVVSWNPLANASLFTQIFKVDGLLSKLIKLPKRNLTSFVASFRRKLQMKTNVDSMRRQAEERSRQTNKLKQQREKEMKRNAEQIQRMRQKAERERLKKMNRK